MSADHKHTFKMKMHLDGCHFYCSTYACECGAGISTYDERDLATDPYSMVWMDNEDNRKECIRCEELLAGAEAKHEKIMTEAGGGTG